MCVWVGEGVWVCVWVGEGCGCVCGGEWGVGVCVGVCFCYSNLHLRSSKVRGLGNCSKF